MAKDKQAIASVLSKHRQELLREWGRSLQQAGSGLDRRISESELHAQAEEFLELLQEAMKVNDPDHDGPAWQPIRDFLEGISRTRVLQGFTSDQTATFIFSVKKPLFAKLREELSGDVDALADETWRATELIDRLGLITIRAFQKTREDVIHRQQQEMLELSTPVVKLWDGILALPMIGTLDSARTQIVMESLLQRIVDSGAEMAIIDITGVPTVDTLVAQHLLKTVTAIRLMGADCIISGVRPQIAQTIVHLGVDLEGVTTKATLADALSLALRRSGYVVTKSKSIG
jgi:rsbT co-antagonist protein RsbR